MSICGGSKRSAGIAFVFVCILWSSPDYAGPIAASASVELGREQRNLPIHNIGLEEIVSLRELHEPRLSPDGRYIAFLVKQAFLGCNCSREALFVVSPNGGSPRKLAEGESLTNVRWSRDGRYIFYLSMQNGVGELWRASQALARDQAESSSPSPYPLDLGGQSILRFEWSHDGRCIAFSTRRQPSSVAADHPMDTAVVYDDRNMRFGSSIEQNVIQLSMSCPGYSENAYLWETSPTLEADIGAPKWSPNDRAIAVTYVGRRTATDVGTGVAIIDATDERSLRNVLPDVADGEFTSTLQWAPDGRSLAAISGSFMTFAQKIRVISAPTNRSQQVREIIDNLDGSFAPTAIYWSAEGSRLVTELHGIGQKWAKNGLYTVPLERGSVQRVTSPDTKISECDETQRDVTACVAESPTTPPGLAIVSLASGTISRLKDLSVNPELQHIKLLDVSEVRWTNKYGDETNGYLIVPDGSTFKRPFPLIVLAYGFFGDFVTQASQVLTSYPAQVFAQDGIAVLLVNRPQWKTQWSGADFERGAVAWGYSPLASLQSIIDKLAKSDLVDPSKVGFAGHSWGGFWTEFAVTHAPTLFSVAAIHNGGTLSEPGSYWVQGSELYRRLQEHFLGGPPYGDTLKNYLAFSPSLNADKVRVPILIEADGNATLYPLMTYTALRRNDASVEFVIYPGEGHVFEKPIDRLHSMRRNLDWFEFWLLGRENVRPYNVEQYDRWRKMRR